MPEQHNQLLSRLPVTLRSREIADRRRAEFRERLFQQAVKANQKGYLASALNKLETLIDRLKDKGTPSGDRDRVYRDYYDAALSELDRIDKAHEEARADLDADRFDQAGQLCEQMQMTAGGFRFRILKFEIACRQWQHRFEFVRQTYAAFESLKELDDRIAFLRQTSSFPDTPHLTELLKLTEGQKDLVSSLIAGARNAEADEEYLEALERLNLARQLQPTNTDLEREISSLNRLRVDQVTRQEKEEFKNRVTELIQDCDYLAAIRLCEDAPAEFKFDEDVSVLQKSAQHLFVKAKEARAILSGAQDLRRAGKDQESLQTLRQAYALNPNDYEIAQFLGDALVECAQTLENTDPNAAKLLYDEAQGLIPDYPPVQAAARDLEDKSRDPAGDIAKLDAQPTAAQVAPSDQTKPIIRQTTINSGNTWCALERAIDDGWEWIVSAFANAKARQGWGSTTQWISDHAVIVSAFAAIIVLILSAAVYWALQPHKKQPSPPLIAVTIAVTPSGAMVGVDHRSTVRSPAHVQLKPGPHAIEVSHPGYITQYQEFPVTSQNKALTIDLEAQPMTVHIISDKEGSPVFLNEIERGKTTGEGLPIKGLVPGKYSLRISGPKGDFQTEFRYDPGQFPASISIPKGRVPDTLFVASLEGRSQAQCNGTQVKLTVADQVYDVDCAGTLLNLTPGDYQAATDQLGEKKFTLSIGAGADVTIGFFWTDERVAPKARDPEAAIREIERLMEQGNYPAAEAKNNRLLDRIPGHEKAKAIKEKLEKYKRIDPSKWNR